MSWHLSVKVGAALLLIDALYLGALGLLAVGNVELSSVFRFWDHLHWMASAVGFALFPGPHAVHSPLPYGLLGVYFFVTVVQWFAIGWLIALVVQAVSRQRHAL